MGPSGGRIEAISLDPTSTTIVIGSHLGGIWRSTDDGATWQQATTPELEWPQLYSIVRHPTRPDTLFAAVRSTKLLKSTDGGATWSFVSWVPPQPPVFTRLVISPDGAVLLGMTEGFDLWYSLDEGATWNRARIPAADMEAHDVAFSATGRAAAVSHSGTSYGANAWWSTDGGLNWTAATGVSSSTSEQPDRIVFAPSDPAIVYLLRQGSSANQELWKSTDAGVSYTKIRDLDIRRVTETYSPPGAGGVQRTQSGPMSLWVDPADSDLVVVGGVDLWRSVDGGVTFTRISDSTNTNSAHGFSRVLTNGPGSAALYVGTDGGIFRTDDILIASAIDSGSWVPLNAGLSIASLLSASGSADGTIIALTDNNTILRFDAGTQTWSQRYVPPGGPRVQEKTAHAFGRGRMTAFDAVDPSYAYATDVHGGMLRSLDGGRTFASISVAQGFTGTCEPADSVVCFASTNAQFALAAPDTLVYMGETTTYRTNPKETLPNWTAIGPQIGGTRTFPLNFYDPATSSALPGLMWVTAWTASTEQKGGAYFGTTLDVRTPAPAWTIREGFKSIFDSSDQMTAAGTVIDPNDPNTVHAVGGGPHSLYRSRDGGETWTLVFEPWDEFRVVTIDPRDSNHVFAADEFGVIRESVDAGQTWQSTSLPITRGTQVEELFWVGPRLYAATRGRGLFVLDPVSDALMHIDEPAGGSLRQPITLRGWAIDRAATSGPGIDAIHVYAYPDDGSAPRFMGVATYGLSRPDVGAMFGSAFTKSGFELVMSRVPPGTYRFVAFAHSQVTGEFVISRMTAPVAVESSPHMMLDDPADGRTVSSPFLVRGWALNLAAPSGTGVDAIHVYAYPASGGAQFLGVASYGEAREDVGAVFGPSFTDSGYRLANVDLSPGPYTIVAFAHDTVTGGFTLTRTSAITVAGPASDPLMSIDTPTSGSTRTQPFNTAGWAIDRAAASGTGVDTIHVWAWPVGGGSPSFVGVPDYGASRPDVGAAFGSQFTSAGYNFATFGLTPGVYDIVVYVRSSVTGTFNNSQTVRITVQ